MEVALTLTPAEMLARLYRLRWCAVLAALLIIGAARLLLAIDFASVPLLLLVLALAGLNLLIGWRLRRGWTATELESFAHLAVDTLALSALLYFGGGSTSPFVSLYLIPIAIAAAALPSVYAWSITGLAAGAYSLLLFNTGPLAHAGHNGFAMHVFGMWVTFILGGLLLMVFVAGMASAVRRRDAALAQAREQMLRNEQVSAMGVLAAGAAHELGTPLSTMHMIVDELQATDSPHPAELAVLRQQIGLCKDQINQLLGAAEQARGAAPASLPFRLWLETIIARWRLMRPEVQARSSIPAALADMPVALDDSIAQALINLFNNAADASLDNSSSLVNVTAGQNGERISIVIEDEGKGISSADIARAGRLRFSTKPGGRGLGLVLSHVSLERIGGEVSLDARSQGGTRTQLSLPLARIKTS